jgi:hypothetical protein
VQAAAATPLLWRNAGSVALSLCTTAYPLHTRFADVFGAVVSEATLRPDPRLNAACVVNAACAATVESEDFLMAFHLDRPGRLPGVGP